MKIYIRYRSKGELDRVYMSPCKKCKAFTDNNSLVNGLCPLCIEKEKKRKQRREEKEKEERKNKKIVKKKKRKK